VGLETPEERLLGGVGVDETDPCGLKPFDSEAGRGLNEFAAEIITACSCAQGEFCFGLSLIGNFCGRRKREEVPGRGL